MTRYAILIRGINVGKAKRIAMADLRAALTGAGYANVATLLQSGNVVLDADQPAAKVAREVEQVVEKRFGYTVDVIVRSHDELAGVVERNPFRGEATDGSRYVVAFLAKAPRTPPLKDLDFGAERHVLDGTELYIWCPDGLRDSPLMAALAKEKGGPTATVRNWNTVEKLLAMMD